MYGLGPLLLSPPAASSSGGWEMKLPSGHTEDDTYDRNDAHQTHRGLLQRVAYVLGRFILFWSPREGARELSFLFVCMS